MKKILDDVTSGVHCFGEELNLSPCSCFEGPQLSQLDFKTRGWVKGRKSGLVQSLKSSKKDWK